MMYEKKINQATLTVIIAAKNEGHQIAACIRSVLFADEILVLDSGSSDDTEAQARCAGATVHTTDWVGYGLQQMRGIGLAKSDWVLSIDADERVTDALRDEICNAISSLTIDGYRLPRHSCFCGKFIEHSGWRPDYTLRLARRKQAGFTDHFLHAHMTVNGKIEDLKSPIIHYSYRNIDDVLEKLNKYSKGAAIDLQNKKEFSSLTKSLLKGLWSFIKTYFLKQGFRDGRLGLVLAIYNAQTTYYKYVRLWLNEYNKNIF